jgi:hypothetical protein
MDLLEFLGKDGEDICKMIDKETEELIKNKEEYENPNAFKGIDLDELKKEFEGNIDFSFK